jgi:hypothetical protein
MTLLVRIALALVSCALASCLSVPVHFAEPAAARVSVGRNERVTLPATFELPLRGQTRVEFEFDEQTLIDYGMSAQRAHELSAAGRAKIVGRMELLGALPKGEEQAHFALPAEAVVRALDSGERVRCWWPAEGRESLWFEGSVDDDGEERPMEFRDRPIPPHTGEQKSYELAAATGGVVVGVIGIVLLFLLAAA